MAGEGSQGECRTDSTETISDTEKMVSRRQTILSFATRTFLLPKKEYFSYYKKNILVQRKNVLLVLALRKIFVTVSTSSVPQLKEFTVQFTINLKGIENSTSLLYTSFPKLGEVHNLT